MQRQTTNCAYYGECDLIGILVLSQEGASQTYQSVVEISRNTGICHRQLDTSSFQSHPHRGKQRACFAANIFLDSVATQLG